VTVLALETINPDPNTSNLFIYSTTCDLISRGHAMVSLTNPEEMSLIIKPDAVHPNGVYVVQWKAVLALDGGPGAFVFTMNTGAVVTPTPVATTSTGQMTTPTPSTTLVVSQG
jgi:hypothetical protein